MTWPFVCVKLEKVIKVTARHGTWWAELRQQKRMREREESATTEEGQLVKKRCLVHIPTTDEPLTKKDDNDTTCVLM